MLPVSNLTYDLLGESTQNLGPIVIAKVPEKDSSSAAVKWAGWQIVILRGVSETCVIHFMASESSSAPVKRKINGYQGRNEFIRSSPLDQ